jgi:hypothetical protein
MVMPQNGSMPMPSMPMTPGMPQNGSMPMTPGMPQNGSMPMPSMPRTPGMPQNGSMPMPSMPMTPGMPQNGSMPMPSMPMTPGMPQNGSMPMPSMPMTPGMPQNGSMPMAPSMPNIYYCPYGTPGMPDREYPGYQSMPGNMYMPNDTPYRAPMGIPLLPLYGYDNSEDLDKDIQYMRQLYPYTAKAIQSEVDNECDKLEYDGSAMFDEYPDSTFLDRIIDRIYDRVRDSEELPQVEMKSIYGYPPRRHQNYLRDIISLILLNEIFNRRRRFRGRRRWF